MPPKVRELASPDTINAAELVERALETLLVRDTLASSEASVFDRTSAPRMSKLSSLVIDLIKDGNEIDVF